MEQLRVGNNPPYTGLNPFYGVLSPYRLQLTGGPGCVQPLQFLPLAANQHQACLENRPRWSIRG